jgi:vacuolar-type H+-ATPase subunit F/Vma7
MDFYVVADEDTVQGFRYAGIPGFTVKAPQEAAAELNRLAQAEAELIVITTEQIANAIRETLNAIRFKEALPLVVEIPGPEGPSAESPPLLKMIHEAIGIKV